MQVAWPKCCSGYADVAPEALTCAEAVCIAAQPALASSGALPPYPPHRRSVTSLATGSVAGSQRFKISIKSADEVQGQQKGDLGALRAAAQVRGPASRVAGSALRRPCEPHGEPAV